MASPISSSPDTCAKVNVLVKNVYAPAQSKTFVVPITLSILELKHEIETVFPSMPAVKDQKLIFGGKICSNDTILDTILKQLQVGNRANESTDERDEPVVVFHLMCLNDLKASEDTQNTIPIDEPKSAPNTNVTQVHQPQTRTSPPSSVAHNGTANNSALRSPSDVSGFQAQFFQQAMLMQQQSMLLMQIQYLEQMKAYYQAFPAMGNASGAAAIPTVSRNTATTHISQPTQTTAHIPRPPAAVVPPHFQHVFGHRNQFPFAQPPQVQRQEPGFFRELLREAYASLDLRLALKMGFMIFIVGQDTPYERVLLLGISAFALYLHITGILIKCYRVYQRHYGRRDTENTANTNGPPAAAALNVSNQNGITALTSYVRISQHRGFFLDVWSFLLGFVCSIVPAWNPNPNDVQEAVRPPVAPIPI